jgi:hypothetical protein
VIGQWRLGSLCSVFTNYEQSDSKLKPSPCVLADDDALEFSKNSGFFV